MNKVKKVFLPIVQGFVLCAVVLQVILGLGYICLNFAAVPKFQDTAIYLQMTEQFAADEYTGLLYPFLVKISCAVPYIPFQVPIYLLQLIVGICSVYTFVSAWTKGKAAAIMCTIWINTMPFIAQAHVTVLPHSLAMSCMIYMLLQVIRGSTYKRALFASEWVRLIMAYVILAQLTRGYLAAGTLFIIWAALLQFYSKQHKALLFFISILACTGMLAMNLLVYHMTAQEGYYARLPKNISTALFKRAGILTFSGKYRVNMPEEIIDNFSDWDINDMQRYQYKIETEMNPVLVEQYGEERTNQIYWSLGMLGIKEAAQNNLKEYIKDSVSYMVPIAAYFTWNNGETHGATGWNYQQFLGQSPKWSTVYVKICHLLWSIGIVISFIFYFITAVKNKKFDLQIWIPAIIYMIIYAGIMALKGTNIYDYKLAVLSIAMSCIPVCIIVLRNFFNKGLEKV